MKVVVAGHGRVRAVTAGDVASNPDGRGGERKPAPDHEGIGW
jgi:hypothetical protein